MKLIGIAIGLLIVGNMIYFGIRRSLQMRKLALDGEITEATIIKKFKTHGLGGAASSTLRYVRYEYSDSSGKTYSHKSLVSDEQWNAYDVGDSIEIVYVKSDPTISGPKYLVDLAREALEKKAAKSPRAE